jgi:hypothetical protein
MSFLYRCIYHFFIKINIIQLNYIININIFDNSIRFSQRYLKSLTPQKQGYFIFLNVDKGSTLLIGVNDDGSVLGLHLLGYTNLNFFINHIQNLL